ncbi:ATP synthase F1 subunit delta [Pelodictyon phaeoclathratiforme]|jgi:F-type H+-transporting ATPase subunit delta|uniref:ATP synthase subunit delta n=1 Tax=Pelodictyon phaeoclathratiforme (strain DSM 5477 / BU-1) TaxID=324925 RepID=ATPD_PELPB|nr:ATP synthase F1 subunit delta [Pelodictyon phaeoclathratiforme]B4SH37.1 RecName: Full=ATP synthase subunit delta; AltName: Full=ATP synthase F(1) sector subunit delta; AltName: Full=F-type ATPase subunit delta; Short=F-ATPase subunit delta [Pelodictyon phaeoclathratiforme BU-1]ACF45025.1 ATP synthase F1, delta subunit [Pelodictyon phaeoclathratiforme BU-1]MBV5288623.1 F0F1 ATP synthase subunit delta [Pelodictyon phaeoclathratiforme]
MSTLIASRRYASALLSAAEEGNFLNQIVDELHVIKEVLEHSRDLVYALRSPLVKGDRKIHILEEIFKDSVGEKMFLFLRLVAHKKRAGLLPEIIDEFQILLDEKRGVINVDITSATALSDEQTAELVTKLAAFTGKEIRPRMAINEQFIGGVAVKIGDTIYDGSISHQLQMLRKSLVS